MFKVVASNELPQANRHKSRTLLRTPEWIEMVKKLNDGLKPYEAAVATFTPSPTYSAKRTEASARIFLSMVKKLIDENKLRYDAWKYRAEDGQQVIVVADRIINALDAPLMLMKRKPGRPRKTQQQAA
jgi:hypothetical protein